MKGNGKYFQKKKKEHSKDQLRTTTPSQKTRAQRDQEELENEWARMGWNEPIDQ